jgi:hypothetical protein
MKDVFRSSRSRLKQTCFCDTTACVMDFVEAEDGMVFCKLWHDLRCFHCWHNLFSQEPQRFHIVSKE